MVEGYEILEVTSRGETTVAVLPLSYATDIELRQRLRADYSRLAASAGAAVELDLRGADYIDGTFLGGLVALRRSLQQRSIPLRLRLSARLEEVIRVTRLDLLFEVIEGPDAQSSGPA